MDERFDNKLNDHIRKVFDNFEDHSADEGWLLLREKFPAKKKDRGIIWLWLGSAAAILLLLLGIGTWVKLKKYEPVKLSYQHNKTHIRVTKPTYNQQPVTQQPLVLNQTHPNKSNSIAANPSIKNQLKLIPAKPVDTKITENNTGSNPVLNNDHIENAVADNGANKPVITNNKPPSSVTLTNNDTAVKKSAVAVVPQPATKPISSITTETAVLKKQNDNKPLKVDDGEKKVRFSVYAATYFNYASGSTGQLNVGAGVTSDIKITKNLMLSTGITIAQNSLNYGSQFPGQSAHPGYLAAVALSSPLSNVGFYNVSSYAIPVLKNYNAQLVALDIPVDLKYRFNQSSFSNYVSVGLSSGTFINESYNSQYSNAGNNATPTQTNTNSFNNFYFAKMLNVAFGLGYPIGKNHLIIEPFLKYPLDGLGAQQIRFGAGGVNLKFGLSLPNAKKNYNN